MDLDASPGSCLTSRKRILMLKELVSNFFLSREMVHGATTRDIRYFCKSSRHSSLEETFAIQILRFLFFRILFFRILTLRFLVLRTLIFRFRKIGTLALRFAQNLAQILKFPRAWAGHLTLSTWNTAPSTYTCHLGPAAGTRHQHLKHASGTWHLLDVTRRAGCQRIASQLEE